MTKDALGRDGGRGRSYQAGDERGAAIEQLMFFVEYRRGLREIKHEVLQQLYPDDADVIDDDIRQADAAVHAAAVALAGSRGEIAPEDLAPQSPNVQGFYEAVATILGGYKPLALLDITYPSIDKALRSTPPAWGLALAGIAQALQDEAITQQQYTDIMTAWDAANLERPA